MTQAATLAQLASSGALTADTSGNVGIGTTTPAYKFDVIGASRSAINFGNNYSASYLASALGTANGQLAGISFLPTFVATPGDNAPRRAADIWAGFNGGNWGTQYLAFGVGAAANDVGNSTPERMRIDSNGQLFINATSTPADANTYLGIINAGGSNYGIAIRNSNTATNQAIGFFNNSGTRIGSVSFTTTATAFNTSSDYRLKEDVQPMVGALDKVAQLKPVTYKWKLDGSDGQGFIAHELQEVVPEAVTGEKDAVNQDGSINPQGIDTSVLVPILTKALQELKAELDVCKAEIAALKGV